MKPLVTAFALLLASTAAHADPAFLTTDRFDDTPTVGASLVYVNVDQPGTGAQRLELFGHYLASTPLGGFGGYGAIGASRVTAETGSGSESTTTLGNLEVGGLWRVKGVPWPWYFRVGYVLQTSGDDLADQFANTLTGYARFTDLVQATSDTAWLRASTSATHRRGKAFYRVDLGIDWPAAGDGKSRRHHYMRLNLAGGYDAGNTALLAELITRFTFADVADNEPRFSHTVALGGRYLAAGRLRPSLALVLPIDDPGDELINWILLLGADYAF